MVYNNSQIAKITGLSRPTVSAILNGKQKNPRIETLEKIASVYKCSIDELRKKIKNRDL